MSARPLRADISEPCPTFFVSHSNSPPPAPPLLPQTRGNQRELDRQKAAKLAAKHAGPPVREGTPQSRNEADAAALKLKLEKKAAEKAAAAAAGGGAAGGGGGKK